MGRQGKKTWYWFHQYSRQELTPLTFSSVNLKYSSAKDEDAGSLVVSLHQADQCTADHSVYTQW